MVFIVNEEDPDIETDFPINMIDYDVENSVMTNGEASEMWRWYRVHIWPLEMTGKVFVMSAEEVSDKLSCSAEVFILHQKNRVLMSSYKGSQGTIVKSSH